MAGGGGGGGGGAGYLVAQEWTVLLLSLALAAVRKFLVTKLRCLTLVHLGVLRNTMHLGVLGNTMHLGVLGNTMHRWKSVFYICIV